MSLAWHKRYHRDALQGAMGLSLEARGVYWTLIDLIYDRAGPIPRDEKWLANWCGCSVRKLKTILQDLVEQGKITALADGTLSNHRAELELVSAHKTARKRAENGAKGARKRDENFKAQALTAAENVVAFRKNNDLTQAEPKPGLSPALAGPKHHARDRNQIPETEQEGLLTKSCRFEADEFFARFKRFAALHGLPIPRKLDPDRRKALEARIADHGVDEMDAALATVADSPHLLGENGRGWKMSFDFFVKPTNFRKIQEGNYVRTRNDSGGQSGPGRQPGDEHRKPRSPAAIALEMSRRSFENG